MLTYCFESSHVPRTLARCKRNDLAVIDTEELKEAECYYLNKKIRDYDIADIMDEQTKFSKEKCKEICKVIKESFD